MRGLFHTLLLFCLCAIFAPPASADEVRIGVLAFQGAERAEGDWAPTIQHLSRWLPQHTFRAEPLDMDGLALAARRADIQFIITNPGHYYELEAGAGASRIATRDAGGSPSRAVASAVIVRAGSGIQRFTDLTGKRLAAVSPLAFGGFRLAWREMAERGVDPFKDAVGLEFVGFPMEKAMEALDKGDVDAAILRACLFEELAAAGRYRATDFHVLEATTPAEIGCQISTRLYPDWPFAKLAHTPDPLARQVALALLSMSNEGEPGWTVPVDYRPVEDLFRALKLGPFDYLARRSLAEILWDNWPWLLIAALAVLWWIAHMARVEFLIRRRTEELRQAHDEARRRREELEHGARLALVGEMASSLAHELNQPLAAITNYARGCQHRLRAGTDAAGVAEGLDLIAGQAERAANIVKRIRAFVRKRVAEPMPVDINAAVSSALVLFQSVAARKGVAVNSLLGDGPLPVMGDQILIEQVVLNLLQNAADAMASQPVRRLDVKARRSAEGIEVSVSDSGPGLSAEARQHLFEPFFTTKPDGLGLGLPLCRSIAEAHGGRLWAEEAASGGACFRLSLPVHEGEQR